MKIRALKNIILFTSILSVILVACSTADLSTPHEEDVHTEEPASMSQQSGFPDKPAIPNDSGIEGVQTFPDKSEYHNHVTSLPAPEGDIPPPSGAHYSAWQNCGIYNSPVELGNALHSLEHGAVWLTYASDISDEQITDLQSLARGHDYVLMSPYPPQTEPVVMTAWGVQLVIDTLPDERIAAFIVYYEQGPQNPEPGAPCEGAVGTPMQ